MKEGKRDPVKTIKAICVYWIHLGPTWRTIGGNHRHSHTIQNADRLERHTCNIKHLEVSVKWLQEAQDRGYEKVIRIAFLDVL